MTVRYAVSSEEVVGLLRQGGYDGASVSSDMIRRVIDHRDVAPAGARVSAARSSVISPLRSLAVDPKSGVVYGAPFLYGANLLLYNAAVVRHAPPTGGPIWRARTPYRGRISLPDSPMTLADAALYLRAHRPALGIRDPYELTAPQLAAVAALVTRQAAFVRSFWTQFTDQIGGFAGGQILVGLGRAIVAQLSPSVPVRGVIPREGATGWADAWMMAAGAAHPRCMQRWMEWTSTAAVQAEAATWNDAAPADPAACARMPRMASDPSGYVRCGDGRFLSSLFVWRTPIADCGGGRTTCADYPAWRDAWGSVPQP